MVSLTHTHTHLSLQLAVLVVLLFLQEKEVSSQQLREEEVFNGSHTGPRDLHTVIADPTQTQLTDQQESVGGLS